MELTLIKKLSGPQVKLTSIRVGKLGISFPREIIDRLHSKDVYVEVAHNENKELCFHFVTEKLSHAFRICQYRFPFPKALEGLVEVGEYTFRVEEGWLITNCKVKK